MSDDAKIKRIEEIMRTYPDGHTELVKMAAQADAIRKKKILPSTNDIA